MVGLETYVTMSILMTDVDLSHMCTYMLKFDSLDYVLILYVQHLFIMALTTERLLQRTFEIYLLHV